MELWPTLGLAFAALVVTAMLKEAARRLAFGLLTAIGVVFAWLARGIYWLLIGWWFGKLRRWVTGSLW